MRFLFLSLFLLPQFFSTASLAQKSEVGFGLGTFNYTGDLVRTYNFSFSKPAGTIFFRTNLSRIISFRVGLTAGRLGADDTRKPMDALAVKRDSSFKASGSSSAFNLFLLEGSTVFEYHFLNWRDDKTMVRFSPYLFAGLGIFAMSGTKEKTTEYSNVQGMIPFGLGFKYVLNPKWYIGIEFGMRKTFFDYLDNISGNDDTIKNYQYGNPTDNDHYYYFGLSLTRAFYTIPCPTNPYK